MNFTFNPKEFFIDNRYNVLYYLSEFLGGIGYLFAIISLHTIEVAPLLSKVFEWRATEFSEWSQGVYAYAVEVTFPYKWEKLKKEKAEEEQNK
jgi:hypothetical protein